MKISRYALGICLSALLIFSVTTAVTGQGKVFVDPHFPADAFVASFDSDPGLPSDSFTLTLGGIPFDFTFTDEGDGGNNQGFTYDPAHGEEDSPSVNLQSYGYNSSSIERVTIRRSDGYDFTFDSIWVGNRGGELVFVAAYDDGVQIGATQMVLKGTSATVDFGSTIGDEVRLTSVDFNNTNIDSFAGNTVAEKDFGDLPASYGLTTSANSGANHLMGDVFLGDCVDSDLDGQPSDDASGDDSDGSGNIRGNCEQTNADDDGVSVASPWSDGTDGGIIEVTVSGGDSCLSAWLDWDGDDNFSGSGDHILDMVPVSAGAHALTFDVPPGVFDGGGVDGHVFARFRIVADRGQNGDCGDDGALTPGGRASGGEVEDYQWSLAATNVGLKRFHVTEGSPARANTALALLLLIGSGLSLIVLRNR